MAKTLAELQAQAEESRKKMKVSLDAAEAATEQADKDKHLAEFDTEEKVLESLNSQITRALKLQKHENEAQQFATAPVVAGIRTPNMSAVNFHLPAQAKRHKPLKIFKGEDAEKKAYITGLWAAATLYGSEAHKAEYQELRGPLAVLGTNNNQSAGYLVPVEMDMTIIELIELRGVFRRNAEVVPMTSDTKMSPRWAGRMVAYWVGEGGKPTEVDPRFNQIQLVAKNLSAMTKISNQLDEDSLVDLGEKVADMAALAFAEAEDQAGFNGDGTSTYGGVTGLVQNLLKTANAASLVTAAATHVTVPQLTIADYQKVLGYFPEYPNAEPKWFCHKTVWANSMVPLQLAGGGNRVDQIAQGGQREFLGYPVEIVQVLPTLSNYSGSSSTTSYTLPVIFGDVSLAAKLGDRRSYGLIAGYENDDFTRQQRTLLATSRVDINVHTVVDPLGQQSVGGPVLGLQLAAS